MFGYVRELEARISDLPRGIKAGLHPQQIAKVLGESLRQHFLHCGVPDTVKAMQATSAAMTGVQNELSAALHSLANYKTVDINISQDWFDPATGAPRTGIICSLQAQICEFTYWYYSDATERSSA